MHGTNQRCKFFEIHFFSKRRKENLFTSSLAVVQTISKLQTGSKQHKRKGYSRATTIEKLNEVLPKFTVLNLSLSDIQESFNHLNRDIEDSVHFVLSQKMKCDAILTNNRKDFVFFKDLIIINSNLCKLKSVVL